MSPFFIINTKSWETFERLLNDKWEKVERQYDF